MRGTASKENSARRDKKRRAAEQGSSEVLRLRRELQEEQEKVQRLNSQLSTNVSFSQKGGLFGGARKG